MLKSTKSPAGVGNVCNQNQTSEPASFPAGINQKQPCAPVSSFYQLSSTMGFWQQPNNPPPHNNVTHDQQNFTPICFPDCG